MKITNSKILILGGDGFIGSWLTASLYENNRIVIVDKKIKEKSLLSMRGIADHENLTMHYMDATEPCAFNQLDDDFDYIINTIALLGIDNVKKNSIKTIITNFNTNHYALELALRQKHLKKFVTFSTSEVYGDNAVDVREASKAVISHPKESRWCYAASKVVAEHLLFAYFHEHGLPVLVIRPFNIYGEYRFSDNAITLFVQKALRNETVTLVNGGSQLRAWCYIKDFIDGVIRAVSSEYIGEDFNIGNPNEKRNIKEVCEAIIRYTNSKSEIKIEQEYSHDVFYRSLNIDKAKKLLGYNPVVTLEQGLKFVIEFFKSNDW